MRKRLRTITLLAFADASITKSYQSGVREGVCSNGPEKILWGKKWGERKKD